MKKIVGTLSTVFFLFGLAAYILALLGNDSFWFGGVVVSAIGFLLAFFAEKGVVRKTGLIGNGAIVFITIIIPFIVTTFFWNEP
ncbi:hypothetical protein F3157_08325 [Virgibacillus dakarensis]|uniref:Uncharacterized protein n=1 Tax=Lentibacillus populi TaxID=1827502 RepID=A0A9W5X7F6_9BACI|nr:MULTISPECIES: hypothetical protein [Bacillaceae]MBT2218336.1 hypothetical protein [Virgibacillus dakarensis]MTW85666.1 hypothetical protein [Virgibacillus dakarensis]GGB55707.1 hypothetical protein GCM10011409_36710 [Lentibacillus populi]